MVRKTQEALKLLHHFLCPGACVTPDVPFSYRVLILYNLRVTVREVFFSIQHQVFFWGWGSDSTFSHRLSTFITLTGWEVITPVTLCVIPMSGCHLSMWESASRVCDEYEDPFERVESDWHYVNYWRVTKYRSPDDCVCDSRWHVPVCAETRLLLSGESRCCRR